MRGTVFAAGEVVVDYGEMLNGQHRVGKPDADPRDAMQHLLVDPCDLDEVDPYRCDKIDPKGHTCDYNRGHPTDVSHACCMCELDAGPCDECASDGATCRLHGSRQVPSEVSIRWPYETLPFSVVEALGLRPGDLVYFRIYPDGVVRLIGPEQYAKEAVSR